MEENAKLFDENGLIKLDDIQVLLDKMVYYSDEKEEKGDINTFATLYNEFSRKLPEYATSIRNIDARIKKINAKKERLDGMIFKKDKEELDRLNEEKERVNAEKIEAENNKNEARKSYLEAKEAHDKLENSINTVENICKHYLIQIKKIDEDVTKAKKNAEIAKQKLEKADENDISYKLQFVYESIETNKAYFAALQKKGSLGVKFEKIVNFINESDEYKTVVGKDLVSEISKNIEEELTKKTGKGNGQTAEELETKLNSTLSNSQKKQTEEKGPIFRDEERIDENHRYMSYQNAKNLGLTNEKKLQSKEEQKSSVIVNVMNASKDLMKKASEKLVNFLIEKGLYNVSDYGAAKAR